jgi:hypothetical protein
MTAEIDGAVPSHKLRRISTIALSILIKALQSEKGAAVDFIPIGGNDGMLTDPMQAYVKINGWARTIRATHELN